MKCEFETAHIKVVELIGIMYAVTILECSAAADKLSGDYVICGNGWVQFYLFSFIFLWFNYIYLDTNNCVQV